MKTIAPFLSFGGVILVMIGLFSDIFILSVLGTLGIVSLPFILKQEKKENKINTVISANEIFNKQEIDNYFIGEDNLSCIGISETKSEVVLLSRSNINEQFELKKLPFSKVFEVKIVEDDLTLITTSRGSQIGGALAGGLLAGGVGAIIGGMGATQYEEQEVRKINLELVIDDISSPIFNVSFMNEDGYYKKYEPIYKDKFNEANHWFKSLSVILKRNELNTKSL